MSRRPDRRSVLGGLAAAALAPTGHAKADIASLIGQVLMVGFQGAEPDHFETRSMLDHAAAGRIGGVLLLNRNIVSGPQIRRLTSAIAEAGAPHPVLVAADQEGGAIQRLGAGAGFTQLPSARQTGQGGVARARAIFRRMAGELSWAGVNMNLGPVVDLARDGGAGVIGRLGRAYSANPQTVSALAAAFVGAHRDSGVLTVPKHFPGHGNTTQDSHQTLPDISATWQPDELAPYRQLIDNPGIPAIMTAHLVHPRFSDEGHMPASLSARTTQALRQGLGFGGVIVTDDLQMNAIRLTTGSDEDAAIRALRAGADLLIFSGHPSFDPGLVNRLHAAIARAVEDGQLSRQMLQAAARRIIAMKSRLFG